jgi:hypothetical protein
MGYPESASRGTYRPSLGVRMRERFVSVIVRIGIATLIAWIFATTSLPIIPAPKWFVFVQVPVVIFVFLCYAGKLLIDTFFYDHHQP